MAQKLDFSDLLFFLTELETLLTVAQHHREELSASRDAWVRANAAALRQREDPSSEGLASSISARMQAQKRLWIGIDGLLSAWARMSLLLFPSGAREKTRGEPLREALEIPPNCGLTNRKLRNAWMHFDERLDQGLVQFSQLRFGPLQPQDFRQTEEDSEGPTGLRQVVMEPFGIRILDGELHLLDPIFEELDTLRIKTESASKRLADLESFEPA